MEKLVVKLNGGAKDAQSKREGIYKLSLDIVNGKLYWIQEEGTSALWFDKKYGNWKIGSKENLGTSASGLYTQCPSRYLDGKKTSCFSFTLQDVPGIHRNLKQK